MSKPVVETVKLVDGNEMPLIGLGTSRVHGDSNTDPGYVAIKIAIKEGYRLIDTAHLYGNEVTVGNAIKEAVAEGLVKREELYVVTKLWNTRHKRQSVMSAMKDSLKRLQLDYVDLYLIHWPTAYEEDGDIFSPLDAEGKVRYSNTHYTETWLGMQDVKDAGLARSIGVSNFNHHMLDDIYAMPCKHKPVANQVECHPYLSQAKLLEYSNKHGVVLMAYCPLGSLGNKMCKEDDLPAVLHDPYVNELAKKYGKTAAQILNRFHIERKICTLPKSVTPSRIRENIEIFDFKFEKEELEKLLTLNKNMRYCTDTGGHFIHDHPLYPFPPTIEY